ncbi:hypothetical protein Tco_0573893 [Tanacetum coccineum]
MNTSDHRGGETWSCEKRKKDLRAEWREGMGVVGVEFVGCGGVGVWGVGVGGCYNIGKICCGGEACHLDEQNPRCLKDWENIDFQDLVVDGECFQVDVHCYGGGGHGTRGGGDGLEGPGGQCLSLTHRGYLVTFVVDEVLDVLVLSE